MNTYNENLRTSIVKTLDDQKTNLQKSQGELSAQEISLYYAQGALISANDKFDDTLQTYENQQDILTSINENNNSAINTVDAATQEKSYVDKAVNNAAVSASNVQLAANAVVGLAGDIGNVYSIVNAADYQTQIYEETLKAKNNMDTTAYNAELASRFAMETTMLTSSITASTVLTESQSTAAALQALNDSYKAQFETTTATLDAENNEVVTANDLEKKAEGLTEDLSAASYGMRSAYELNNLELNSGLKVLQGANNAGVQFQTATSFYAEFHPYLTPLYGTAAGDPSAVQEYYVIIVDSASKSTFSTASAETVIGGNSISGKPMFVSVDPSSATGLNGAYREMVTIANVASSNREDVVLGTEYCLFLYIKMTEAYKKSINNYEDVLSAGSENFTLTNQLAAVSSSSFNKPTDPTVVWSLSEGGKIEFAVNQTQEFKMEYRVMFLPNSPDKVGNMLSDSNIPTVKERNRLERMQLSYKALIDQAESDIATITAASQEAIADLDKDLEDLKESATYLALTPAKKTQAQKVITDQKTAKTAETDTAIAAKNVIITDNQTLMDEFAKNKVMIFQNVGTKGVFFNLDLAEQVPSGLFSIAANKVIAVSPNTDSVSGRFTVELDQDTTDNFGNKLNEGDNYIPVVLSYSTAEASTEAQFSNALSDFESTQFFKYS